MNTLKTDTRVANVLSWIVALILAVLPFHAFLTVWLSSLVGYYTALRLWKEFLLVVTLFGVFYVLLKDKKLLKKYSGFWPARLIFIYSLVVLFWAFWGLSQGNVTSKAMWYGVLVNLRFLVFFLAVWVIASKSRFLLQNWQRIIFIPAILVSAFAILQFLVLPYDFLKHFGYSSSTIFPYETINHNINHLRVASTLRGANPLGAYLVIPIIALAVLLFKKVGRKSDGLIFGAGLLLAMVFSFSRSAWLGLVLGLAILIWVSIKSPKLKRNAFWGMTCILVVVGLLTLALRNNTTFQNIFFHTDSASKIQMSSNEGHSAAFKSAAEDIYHQPLGRGVGSAGPESFYNNHPARISENYFLQIGQETGLIGIALFIAILATVGKMLWVRRGDPLALSLLASLVAISLINLLSHAWTDDSLAYIWWGLTGVALAPKLTNRKTQEV